MGEAVKDVFKCLLKAPEGKMRANKDQATIYWLKSCKIDFKNNHRFINSNKNNI